MWNMNESDTPKDEKIKGSWLGLSGPNLGQKHSILSASESKQIIVNIQKEFSTSGASGCLCHS